MHCVSQSQRRRVECSELTCNLLEPENKALVRIAHYQPLPRIVCGLYRLTALIQVSIVPTVNPVELDPFFHVSPSFSVPWRRHSLKVDTVSGALTFVVRHGD